MKISRKKKVLILSGISHMIEVVETAKKMGLYTIVTDNLIGAPAKKYADKSYDVSTADIGRLAEIAVAEKIDGVFNAFDDVNTWNGLALCKKLGLPFYATSEQLEICSNKDRFKEYCKTFNVPVIEDYSIDESLNEAEIAKLTFPVIIKPVDSYASQGITVCYSKEELKSGFEKAVSFSKSRKAIVERFVDNSHGVMMYYTIQNKNVVLSAITDRFVHKLFKEHPPLPNAVIFPSQHRDQYIETLDGKVKEMIRGMEIENGVLFIQSLVENNEFFLYEMGFRISGSQHYRIIEKQTGVNLLEMMLDFSVGESLDKYDISKFDNSYMPYPSCNLPVLLTGGTIAEIKGLEQIKAMPEVISAVVNKKEGDEIKLTGTYSQMFGRFNIVANSMEELNQTINKIHNTLQIISTDGKEMVIAKFQAANLVGQG